MADDFLKAMNRDEVLSSLARSQSLFAETLVRGTVPVKEELRMRTQLAELFTQVGTQFSDQKLIDDAIQHLDTILRRIGKDSSDRARVNWSSTDFPRRSSSCIARPIPSSRWILRSSTVVRLRSLL